MDTDTKKVLRKYFEGKIIPVITNYVDNEISLDEKEKKSILDSLDSLIVESFDTFVDFIDDEIDNCIDNIEFEVSSMLSLGDLNELDATNDFYLSELPKKQHWNLDEIDELKDRFQADIKDEKSCSCCECKCDKSDEVEWEEQEWSKMDEDFI
jgi:hypothetical protein